MTQNNFATNIISKALFFVLLFGFLTLSLGAFAAEPTPPALVNSFGIPMEETPLAGATATPVTAVSTEPVAQQSTIKVEAPVVPIVQGTGFQIETKDFKPTEENLKITTNDLVKTAQTAAKDSTVRTGAFSIFLLIAVPVAVMLYYQYKFMKSKRNVLATTEQKIDYSKK
jgi:hypothetical protein